MAKRASTMKGGIKRPALDISPVELPGNTIKENGISNRKKAGSAPVELVGGMLGRNRNAGMMIDNVQNSRAFLSGYALESYRTSYANGLNNRSGTYDVPSYFLFMNQQNGGLLYYPVTLVEKYSWYRFFARADAYVGRSIDLLVDLPLSKISLNMPKMEGKDKLKQDIHDFFTHQAEILDLFQLCQDILYETLIIGNCFIYFEFDEEKVMWTKKQVLPPEECFPFKFPYSDETRIEYRPERLMALMKTEGQEMVLGNSQITKEIIANIPKEIVEMVKKDGCLTFGDNPNDGSFVAHLTRRKHAYHDLGASILERILRPMLLKENFVMTQLSLANRNMTPRNLVVAPQAMPDQLQDLRQQIDLSMMDPDATICVNFPTEWQVIGAENRLLPLDNEYARIEDQVFSALGVNRELITGEGGYSGNRITVEMLNTMFMNSRQLLQEFIEKKLFMPLCEKRGWYEEGAFGVKHYYYPKIEFNRLSIRDNSEMFQMLFQMYQKGALSVDVIYDMLNLDADKMSEKLKKDLFTPKDTTFNALLETANQMAGQALVQNSDLVPQIAKTLGLNMTQGMQANGQGFGGGFGESAQQSLPEQIASALVDIVPANTTPQEVSDIVNQIDQTLDGNTNVSQDAQTQQNPDDIIAETIAETIPKDGATVGDLEDIVEEVSRRI